MKRDEIAKLRHPPFLAAVAAHEDQHPRANIRAMSDHHIQLMMLIVQTAGVIGLAIYCFETYRIRKTSQDQVTASQRVVQAAMDQVEGSLKPCIAFAARRRQGEEAILEMDGAVGNQIAQPDEGKYVIDNIGNGAALNLRYFFTRPNVAQPWRYLPVVLAAGHATLVETLNLYNAEHVATFEYESIGGRKYRSTISLNHHVITAFNFEEILFHVAV
jgi:hypothetical protein